MRKKRFLIPLAVIISVALFALFFAWRLRFLEVPVRMALEDLLRLPVTFERVEYRPFNRVTVRNLTVGSSLRCEAATVYLNPLQLLRTPRKPQLALLGVHLTTPRVLADSPEIASLLKRETPDQAGAPALTVSWEQGELRAGTFALSRLSGRLTMGERISGRTTGESGGHRVSAGFSWLKAGDRGRGEATLRLSGPKAEADLKIRGEQTDRNRFSASFELPVARAERFSLGGSSGSIAVTETGFWGRIAGPAGSVEVQGASLERMLFSAQAELSALTPSSTGHLELSGERNGQKIDSSARIAGLVWAGTALGDFSLDILRQPDGTWTGEGRIEPLADWFFVTLKNHREITLDLRAGETGSGRIEGAVSPFGLSVDVAGWPLGTVPWLAARYPGAEGVFSATGTVTTADLCIDITGSRWRGARDAPPLSWKGRVLRKEGNWFFHAKAQDSAWTAAGKLLAAGEWDVKAQMERASIGSIVPWLGAKTPVEGTLTGSLTYSSKNQGDVSLSFRNLAGRDLFIDEGSIGARMTGDGLDVREVRLSSGKGTVSGQAKASFLPGKNDIDAHILFYRFPVKGHTFNGPLDFNGALIRNGTRLLTGSVTSKGLKINELPSRKLSADILVSEHEAALKNFSWESLLQGSLLVRSADGALSGKCSIARLPLKEFVPSMDGHLSGTAVIAGTLSSPKATIRYRIPDTEVGDLSFEQTGTVVYEDRRVHAENVRIASGSGTLEMRGRVYPDLDVTGMVDNFPAESATRHGKLPFALGGTIRGPLTAQGPYGDLKVNGEIAGRDITLDGVPVTEFKAGFTVHRSTVTVHNLLARFSDSELHLMPGSTVELAARRFDLRSEWRNVHLGPTDIFGGVMFAGTWHQEPGREAVVKGTVSTSRFWINQHNLEKISFDVQYSDRGITFLPREKQQLALSGHLSLARLPAVDLRNLSIAWKKDRSLAFDGTIGPREWKFAVVGKRISGSALAELLELPVPVEGNVDVNIMGRGNPRKPVLEGSVNLSGGMIADIPFDNANVQFGANENVITLMQARLVKAGQYAIVARGHAPFALTAEDRERVKNDPVDLTVNIEQGTLALLGGLTKTVKSARGELQAQLNIGGTLAKPVENGYILINNGEITADGFYVSRVSGLKVDCVWKDSILDVREFSARIGEGVLRIGGTVKFEGLKPAEYHLTAHSEGRRGIAISVPELPIPTPFLKTEEWKFLSNLSKGEPKVSHIKLEGPASRPVLSGRIELENTRFTYPSLVKRGEGDGTPDLLANLRLDLELVSGKNTWYDNELVSANIQGGIRLTDRYLSPTVSGQIESYRGNISYLGTEFKVKWAKLEINKNDVFLEGEAETQVYGQTAADTDTVGMFIEKARIGAIKPRFVSKSNPGLSSEKSLAKAARIPEEFSANDRELMLRQQMIRIFDSTLATPLARALLQRSGLVDTFSSQHLIREQQETQEPADPTIADLLEGTKFSAGKYINDRTLVAYSVTFDKIQKRLDLRHELELSYRWTGDIFLRGTYEIGTNNPFRLPERSLMIERKWRFGWTKDGEENGKK